MVAEINHPILKGFSRCEWLILAAGHGCNCLRDVLLHRTPSHQKSTNYVRRCIPVSLISVTASLGVQHLRKGWRERKSIHNDVAIPDGRYNIVCFGDMTPMVAIFANQEEHPRALGWFLRKQANRKIYGIANRRSVVAR